LVGKGRVNGGSIDVDFSADALYAPYYPTRRAEFEYIEVDYNRIRRRRTNAFVSPAAFEATGFD
jgi:hypothetical protein